MKEYRFDVDLYKDNEAYINNDAYMNVSYTISTASCEEHATELLIDYIENDYPDSAYLILNSEEINL